MPSDALQYARKCALTEVDPCEPHVDVALPLRNNTCGSLVGPMSSQTQQASQRPFARQDDKFTFIEGVKHPQSCTILIQGSTDHSIAQMKDAGCSPPPTPPCVSAGSSDLAIEGAVARRRQSASIAFHFASFTSMCRLTRSEASALNAHMWRRITHQPCMVCLRPGLDVSLHSVSRDAQGS